jgi:hypothetical protein
MARFDGSLARKLDFGELPGAQAASPAGRGTAGLRLAPKTRRLTGPDKYAALDHRRHQAQIKARRLLDLL